MQKTITKENINMFNDVLFKEFFKSKEARNLVSRFLSAVTGMKKEVFLNATYVTEELNSINIKERRKTSDVIVRIDDNNRIIVELNQNYDKYIFYKNTGYAFNIINSLSERGEHPDSSKVILINIDNFNAFKTDLPILEFRIRDQVGHIENDLYTSIHIIVENINNKKYNVDKEIENFSHLLNEESVEEMKSSFEGDEDYMAGIVKIEDMLKDIDKVGLLYDYEENKEFEKRAAYETGIDEGVEKKTQEAVKNFYKNGVSKELICKSLNITEEQFDEYLNEE